MGGKYIPVFVIMLFVFNLSLGRSQGCIQCNENLGDGAINRDYNHSSYIHVAEEESILVENIYSHGWVAKYTDSIRECGNVTYVDVAIDPSDGDIVYSMIVEKRDEEENVSFVFHLYRWDTDNVDIQGRHAYIHYYEIANFTVVADANLTPMISHLDTTILQNRTYILAFSLTTTQWTIKLKVSHIYVYKYENLDLVGDEFVLLENITDYSLGRYFFSVGISLDSYNNDFVLMYGYGYYEFLWGVGLFVGYCLNMTYWGESGINSTYYDFYIYNKIIAISNVILDNDVVYGATTLHWNQIDLDWIVVMAWNISDNYTSLYGGGISSFYSDYFGSPPDYKWISISLYNGTNYMIVLWEGHTEIRQYLFQMYCYVGDIRNNSDIAFLYEDIALESKYPSNIECVDTDYSDNDVYFLMLEYDEDVGMHAPTLINSSVNTTTGIFEWGASKHLCIGDIWPLKISSVMTDTYDIFGSAICIVDSEYDWAPIIIYSDTDKDCLGDWEESNVYLTNPNESDTDGDGIIDGSEVYTYGTEPNLYDSDNDGLDDKFELEKRPDIIYDQYGGCKNLYITNPCDNDTDDDGILDYYEVVGDYMIGTRHGYKTDPTKNDTDGDGLMDFDEIYFGVEYWIGTRNNVYVSYPNATLVDTDGDGISDYDEKQLELDPTSMDTDDDGIDDYRELYFYVSNPHMPDTDGDGLSDGLEVSLGTDILKDDTDGDGLSDGEEIENYSTDPFLSDTDGDGLNDYEETKVYGTDPLNRDTDGDGLTDSEEVDRMLNPKSKDSDGDGIPDIYDILLPHFPDYVLIISLVGVLLLYRAYTYGVFRNWKRDIIAIGIADVGGVPMFILPEDFKTRYDLNLISSGLLGIHTLTSEIIGKELRRLVLSGELPVFISKSDSSIMFAFIKKEYPKIIKQLTRLHGELESNYEQLLASWSGLVEESEEIKLWLQSRLGIQ